MCSKYEDSMFNPVARRGGTDANADANASDTNDADSLVDEPNEPKKKHHAVARELSPLFLQLLFILSLLPLVLISFKSSIQPSQQVFLPVIYTRISYNNWLIVSNS